MPDPIRRNAGRSTLVVALFPLTLLIAACGSGGAGSSGPIGGAAGAAGSVTGGSTGAGGTNGAGGGAGTGATSGGGTGAGGSSALCPNGGGLPSNVTFNITSDSAKMCVGGTAGLCALPKGYCAVAYLTQVGGQGLAFNSASVVLPLTATAGAFNGTQAMMVTGSIEIDVKGQVPFLDPGAWSWSVGYPTLGAICPGHGTTFQNVNYSTTQGASGEITIECGKPPPVIPVKVGLECVLAPNSCL